MFPPWTSCGAEKHEIKEIMITLLHGNYCSRYYNEINDKTHRSVSAGGGLNLVYDSSFVGNFLLLRL